jgi:hypothetical protein
MRMRWIGPAAVVAAVLSSTPAFADAIVITSGGTGQSINYEDATNLLLIGAGTRISADAYTSLTYQINFGETTVIHGGSSPEYSCCGSFHPTHNVMINGVLYPSVWLSGGVNFIGAPFVAPSAPEGTYRSFETTFMMTGQLQGYSEYRFLYGQNGGVPLFDVELTGTGIVRTGPYRVVSDGHGGFDWNQRGGDSFTFTDSSMNPTPEPATLLLFASGLVAVGARRLELWRSVQR